MSRASNYFVRDSDLSWSKATAFKDWIVKIVEQGRTKDPEFQSALKFWGREHLLAIWKEHRASQAGKEVNTNESNQEDARQARTQGSDDDHDAQAQGREEADPQGGLI